MDRLIGKLLMLVALIQCVTLYDPCEIDLIDANPEQAQEITKNLDEKCRNLSGDERAKAKAEAQEFANYVKKLHDFEANKDPNYIEPAEGEDPVEGLPEALWGVRFDLYNQTELWLCKNATNYASYGEYLDCALEARRQMQELLAGHEMD